MAEKSSLVKNLEIDLNSHADIHIRNRSQKWCSVTCHNTLFIEIMITWYFWVITTSNLLWNFGLNLEISIKNHVNDGFNIWNGSLWSIFMVLVHIIYVIVLLRYVVEQTINKTNNQNNSSFLIHWETRVRKKASYAQFRCQSRANSWSIS